jgi:dihydrofolate reductase
LRALEEPLEWQNSTLIEENVAEEISRLKQQSGKDISIVGRATLVRSLLRDDRIMVHRSWWAAGSASSRTAEIGRRWS